MLLIRKNAQTIFVCKNFFSFLTLFSLLPTFLFFPHAYHLPHSPFSPFLFSLNFLCCKNFTSIAIALRPNEFLKKTYIICCVHLFTYIVLYDV